MKQSLAVHSIYVYWREFSIFDSQLIPPTNIETINSLLHNIKLFTILPIFPSAIVSMMKVCTMYIAMTIIGWIFKKKRFNEVQWVVGIFKRATCNFALTLIDRPLYAHRTSSFTLEKQSMDSRAIHRRLKTRLGDAKSTFNRNLDECNGMKYIYTGGLLSRATLKLNWFAVSNCFCYNWLQRPFILRIWRLIEVIQ